ncbi:zinc ribbon domain-containing protein [Salarchaeum sp. JOR-1]|uniref:double zinc ribbon domain-containing protein n=1 Tax=Salarchaeum sp. JOR-1 TaxID=2599399 RepID=UPI001198B430|nr:zinc ribbon domain-containing protein [Salarchaeum sp. JOR-1]QDX39856.1 ribbon-helix-helix protein, CopG family [Salarchaeum sp. JOR-1]
MSKITFRADDDLVRAVESLDASKSEVMREALREYLDERAGRSERRSSDGDRGGSLDALVAERVDELVAECLGSTRGINVNVSVDGENAGLKRSNERVDAVESRESGAGESSRPCPQCGESVESDHVYCPNCGEKAGKRAFCECSGELRAEWAFCPECGRRTASAGIVDR